MNYTRCSLPSTRRLGAVERQSRGISHSLEAVVNTAWAITLWSYHGQNHVTFPSVGTVSNTRTIHQCEAALSSASSFTSVVEDMQKCKVRQVSDITQHTPSSQTPSSLPRTTTIFTDIASDSVSPGAGAAHPILLECTILGESSDFSVHFYQTMMPQKIAERLLATFAHILDLVMSSPVKTLGSVDLVSGQDKAELWAWNNAQAPETVNSCAHILFQRQVSTRPQAMAIEAWDGSFTYEELDRCSTRTAHYLVSQGVSPECVVPMCFDKSRWAVIAMMAVIKAGGAIAFIDPSNPASRREEIVRQLNFNNKDSIDFLLTDSSNAASWEAIGVRPIIVDQALVNRQCEFGAVPRTGITPTNLLYVIFTSGSTGKPKGCLITHNAFLSGALQHAAGSNLGPESRVMQLASYSFDVSVLEILTSLISGACICTPSSAAMTQGLSSIINDYRISWAFLTPTLVKLIKPYEVPTLQTLILGGELLNVDDVRAWAPCVQLINGYGPSECSIAAAGAVLAADSDPATIGRAIGGLGWIVQAEDHNQLVPIGCVGELLISGPILARGYLNNPEQTAEVFIENPTWSDDRSGPAASFKRFYKTGDLAKFNSDGTIHFIGRKDTQVKLRGLRIELGEIEHNIVQHPHVRDVAVYVPKEGPCRDKLVAVISLHDFSRKPQPGDPNTAIEIIYDHGAKKQLKDVEDHLASRLQEYMLPGIWIAIEAWPLLTSAKLDRKSVHRHLEGMDTDTYHGVIGLKSKVKPPDNPKIDQVVDIEAKLDEIFGRILNMPVEMVPRDKSFLGLGGDSIAAMQVMSQCRAAGISLTAKDIMRCKSIPQLARSSVRVTKSENFSATEEIFDTPFQLSPVQRMYAARLRPDYEEMSEVHFNQSFYLRLAKSIPRRILKAGLDAIVTRHSMLRARFMRAPDGNWTQKVLGRADGSYRFKCHLLETIEQATTAAAISQQTLGLAGPVFSVDLFEVGEEQFLFMAAHHAVIDWVSWRVLLRDLEEFLESGTLARQTPLPFQNWIGLQAKHEAGREDLGKGLPFEIPSPNFAYWDMDSKPNTVARSIEQVFKLDVDSTTMLLGPRPHEALRTEPLDFFLTSLFYSFSKTFTDRALPAIFREGHGREPWDAALDVSETVGWFTTMYPLAVEESGADLVATLKNVKDVRHSVPDNGRSYFASRFHNDRAAELYREHDMIEISFDYLGQFQTLERSDAILRREPRPLFLAQSGDVGKNLERLSLFEITVEVLDGQLQYSFVYNKEMRFQPLIQVWIDQTKQTLQSLIAVMLTAPPSFTLADFPHLSITKDGLQRLLDDRLPKAGVMDLSTVEEVYACSPMQQSLLVSQSLTHQALYEYCHVMEVKSVWSGQVVDAERFAAAWIDVVQRHSALRTLFIQSTAEDGLFDQVVLRSVESNTTIIDCSEEEAHGVLAEQKAVALDSQRPPHRLTICRISDDKLICQLQINHAIIDGGSIVNLVRDVNLAYHNSLTKEPGPRFSDYIGYIQSLDNTADLGFWKDHLQGQIPCLIPCLAELEEVSAEDNRIESFGIEVSLSVGTLKEFCEKSNITMVNLFQVAWGLVLRAFTDSSDVSFGYLSSGRDAPIPGIEDGIGAFLTMLVCRLDLSDGVKLSDVLQKAAEDFANALPHQHCGLASIQHSLGLGRDPLFNTILSFNRLDLDDTSQAEAQNQNGESGIAITGVSTQDPTEYPLSLEIGVLKSGIVASIQHWTNHLTTEQADSIARTFDKALCTIVDHPDLYVRDSDIVHQHHLDKFVEFNGNGEDLPVAERLLFTSIEENARNEPDAEAICAWDGSWTYKELDDAATKLAHYLRTLGVGPETIVPYCFNKSAWAAVTMLGISKAGGAFVGLDPTHPRSRLEDLIAEVNASVLCVCPETAGLFQDNAQGKTLVVIERRFLEKLPIKSGKPCPELKPTNLACIILTSGTTGKPKTIAIEHRSMSTMSDLLGPRLKMDKESRVFQFAAYTYDISTHDIFVTLQRGGCVCMPSEAERVQDLGASISRLRANWVSLTNTVLNLLRPDQAPSLKFIITGGEPVSRAIVETWVGAGVEIVIGCGPAETTITMSVSSPLHVNSHPRNIGWSYGGRAWIVDSNDHDRLVPLGSAGEVLLEGPQLARCYLNNPEKTDESFIWNPRWARSMTPGVDRRFYKSGDICRYNMDGSLCIVGRKDTQVKINGRRIELEEISYKIKSFLSGEATVLLDAVPLKTIDGAAKLIAFLHYSSPTTASRDEAIILPNSEELTLKHCELQDSLQSCLPQYMVPFMYIPVSHIPRTANGKLDRKHLRAAISRLSHKEVDGYSLQDTAKQAPASEAERLLQSLWANILSRPSETIGANDDFFRLGGDSVSAIRLVAAARAQNTPLTVASIFRSPRLSDMALALEGTERNQGDDHSMVLQDTAFDLLDTAEIDLESVKADAAEQCRVDSQKIQDIYPCTTLQEGLMSLSTRLGGGSYLAQSVFRLGPNFDIAKFKSAWQTVAKLEPILRTRIVHMGTFGTLQVVLDEDLEWIEVEDGVDAYLSKDLQEPVSYGSPLLRLALVRSSEGYHFVWSAHHAVYDAWSVNITFGQVRQAFSGEQISTAVAYKEFIRHLEQNNSDEASRAFWDSQFSSTKPAPTTLPLVPAGYTQSSHQTERASPSTKISCTDGTTVSTILRAAWALTVARYTDSDDVVFAATLSGRTVPVDGISTINGPTMATVPVRVSIDLAGEMTAQQLLRAIQTQATDMMAFEQTGLQNIRRVNATASNAIDGMGNLLVLQPSSSSTEPPSFEGIELIPRDLAEFGGYPLVIICHINDNGSVTIEAKYDALLIPSQQMQRMIRHYAFVMDQLCQEPNARLCEIHNNTSPMDLAEIVRWNGPLPEALQMRVHDVVSDRAKEDPDAQAVSAWDGNFTYGELELITDKLASHLQSLGVGTEAKVGLCVEKSRWHVVAMLSVLKAGGAYTNINPLYPATATHQMLQDLEATTVLCSAQYVSLFPASTTEHVVVLDAEFFEQLPAPAVTPITSNVNPNNAAFVVFTSGSTGKPKGVTVEHSGFSSMQHYQTPKLEIGKATRMLQFAAHWFDISNFEAFAALMSGACVCIPSEEERLDDLAAAINKYAVNWATMVPTAAAVLEPEDVPGLKHLSLGGESIPPDLHARWSKRVMLMNSYGPAECSVLTTMGLLQPHTLSQNIGVGVACRTWITDKSNSDLLVPIGCVGELCVEGPILSRGYHKEEGLTCQAYIFNPDFVKSLSTKSTVRIYKTGDLVRYASDGTLVYVGRKDSQVKIHGRRIECGEVEHHIVSHGFSADSVVVEKILESDNAERPILAAFIRLQTSSVEEERESARSSSLLANKFGTDERGALVALRRALEDGLPPHMIPSVFITLRYMPVTHTGKKDRKALKQLGAQLTHGQLEKFRILGHDSDKSLQELGVVSSICSSYFELQLQVLWSKILGITQDSIGANDHFIQKGGDSVRAVRLSAAIRRELSRILSVGDIFSHPRLGEMAKCLDSQTDPKIAAAAESESIYASGSVAPFALVGDKYDESEILDHVAQECQVRTDDIEDIYPCTPLQAGMMAISTYEPDAYVAKRVFKIPDGINLEVFKQAWGRAAEAIPILRTRIVPNPKFDASLQVVLKNETPEWHEIRGSVKTYLTQQRDNWNIAYGQPLSAYGIAPRSRRFVWAIHHALYDGFTASRVIDIVQNFYYCMTLPQPTLPSFSRFIHHLEIVDSARSARFWRENLGGSGSPSSYPRLPSAAYQPQPDSEYVFSFDMTHHASAGILKATLLRAAWAFITAKYMERDDIVFGETLSGRNSSVDGIEDIMGPCITTVPMRVKMDGRQGIRQFLDQMQAQSTAMIPFQHIGLQALRALGPEIRPSLEFNNLFEIVMLEVMDQAQETAKEQQFIHEIENKKLLEGFFNTYALVMECVVRNNQVSLEVKFDHNVLSEWQVERLCSHFEKVVDQFSTLSSNATNTGTLDDLEMVSQQDMALIRSWNTQNNIEYVDSAVHDIFAEQVRASPHSLAISSWDGEMTYHQLDELSTILAKTLVSRWEVKVEDVIPLCFEKSKWAIVAALGVVKAGGAVAHLGSSDPLSRRKEVLHQTKARFIITSPKQADSFDGIEGLTPLLLIDDQRIQHMRLIQKAERAVVSLPKVSSRNAVYVLFTSGSTGQPKGIVVEHGNLSTSSRTHGATFNINAGTRVFQFAAYTFDVSCADIFTSLQRGATVCVPSEEERVNDLANAITRYNADWMFATPTVARLLDPESVPTLRTLVLGGEAPTKDNIESWACREDLQLMFTWGPAETTIYASASAPITLESSPKRLGKAMGCRMWLCDPMDHNKLVPIGCVGEIVVEGGIVSRGYMDEEKTTAVYFQNPSWLRQDMVERDNPPHCHRMYKTGDLARYDMDGIMRYVGRKDDQVKLQGQRIELAEVEHHILTRPGVHRALTRVPRAGPLKDKLVAVISFLGTSSDQSNNTGNNSSCLIPLSHTGKQPVNFEDIRQGLNYSLPSYMVPSFYVAVEAIPMNSNGKIDRKITGQWLEGMDLELYKTLMTTMVGTGDESEQHASTQEEAIVLSLVSRVLNLTDGSARLGLSFLNQGGDSITAMQLRTKAKAEGLNITMQDILKSQSLSAIASAAKSTKMSKQADEVAIAIEAQPKKHSEQPDISFGLSPIQQLFFEAASQYSTTPASLSFNQSFLLRINRTVTEQEMGCALEALVTRHAMLRARFSKAPDGQWSQSISDRPVNKSFSFRVDHTETVSDVTEILTTRGGNLVMGNVEDGPLFVAHMFNISGKDLEKSAQQLFLSAHHLVVDLVSWRIILNDLQDLLTTGVMAAGSPVPYQTWLQLQQEYALTLKPESVLPLESISEAHIDYWGLDKTSRNTFDQLAERQFLLSEEVTTKLFGPSNQAFNTEPVDIILASIATAFQEIFTDRSMPHIFAEGHGRESWDESIDPNGTVGWFTTMSPIQVPSSSTDLATNVRMMKDTRRRIPRNGMPYFSSRFLTQDGRERLGQHAGPIEILFNYVGKYQQLESKDALFAEVDRELWGQAAEVCGDVNRFALIDIGVVVADGKTRVAFAYNKNMLHQEMISTWIDRTESIITRGVETLKGMTQSRTMGDFPLLISQLNTEKLALVERSLSDTGESMGTILDMYPCTPMQQHILTVQNKEGQRLHGRQKLYEVEISHQILSRPANTVSLEQLQTAWQHVIDEHPILRTIFVSAPQTGDNEPNYLQVVLSSYHANVPIIQCEDETELLRRVKEFRSVNYQNLATPHHQFTIFTTGDGQKVTCKLEISHALNDGISTGILFRDLEVAYRKRSKLTKVQLRGTGFGDYMAWLEGQKTQDAEDHWYKLIQGATCGSSRSIVPHQHEKSQTPTQKSLEINLNRTLVAALTSFCHYHGVTLATFFQTVWGLVLQSQAQSETKELKKIEVTPFFGYMMANRDAVDGRCENMVGPLTNMLLAETDVPANTRIGELLRRRQSEFLEALTHQFGLAGAVKKARGTQASSGKISNVERGGNWDGSLGGLCNSIMSLQYVDADGGHIPQDTTKRPRPLSMIQASARKTLSMTRGSHHTSSRSFSEGFNARSQPEDYTRVPNSGRKLRHVSWSGNSMISKHDLNWRLSQKSKASTENEITFRPLAYQDPNDYDISLGVQVLKAPQSDRRDGVHVKAQLVYWSDVISDGRAETMRRAFERCAEELVSDGTGCLRVWVLLRRIAPSA